MNIDNGPAFHILLLAAVIAKALILFGIQRIILPQCNRTMESFVAAWLLAQTLLIGLLMALSVFSSVRMGPYWLGQAGLIVLIWLICRKLRAPALSVLYATPFRRFCADIPAIFTALFFGLILAAFLAHAYHFYDTTDDALYYGLSRIAWWYQHGSIWAFEPTMADHLFTFPWNGELNAFSYFVATGQDRACAFGNVEIWLLLGVAIHMALRRFGVQMALASGATILLVGMPAIIFLAFTVKGDLCSVFGVSLGIFWTFAAFRKVEREYSMTMAATAFAFAIGSKITAAVVALPFLLVIAMLLLRHRNRRLRSLGIMIVLVAVNCAFLVNNLKNFGSLLPEPSMPGDQPTFAVAHFASNFRGLYQAFVSRSVFFNPHYALFAGCGLLGVVTFTLLIAALGRGEFRLKHPHENIPKACLLVVLVLFALSLLTFMFLLPWYAWSFRYYLPWIIPIFVVSIGSAFQPFPQSSYPHSRLAVLGMLFLSVPHYLGGFQPSEVTPGPSIRGAYNLAYRRPDLERKLAAHPYLIDFFAEALSPQNGRSGPLSILVLCGASDFIFPFFGNNAENHVSLVENPTDLVAGAQLRRFDLVVATRAVPDAIAAKLNEIGYLLSQHEHGMQTFRPYSHNRDFTITKGRLSSQPSPIQ